MSLLNAIVPVAHAQITGFSQFKLFTLRPGGDVGTAQNFVVVLLNWFLVIVAIIAFVYLVLQGLKYITSGGDAAKATEARNGIINAIIGIIVIVLAFFIIRFAVSFGNTPTGP
jgi:ABC-type phosphate transport system permease subunit